MAVGARTTGAKTGANASMESGSKTDVKAGAKAGSATKKRIQWIDIAKGIGIVLMIVGHTFLNESFSRKLVFSFHMPVFFILAGYTFRVKPMRDVVQSSVKRLLVPYIIAYWAAWLLSFVQQPGLTSEVIVNALAGFVFASGTGIYDLGFPPAGVIWFLVALFCSRLTMNAIQGIFEQRGMPEWGQFAFWVVFAALGIVIGEVLGIKLPLSYDVSMVACLFMYVGYFAKNHDVTRLFKLWWTFPAALVLWIVCIQFSYLELAARRYDIAVFAIVGACAGSYMVYQISYLIEQRVEFLVKPLAWLGVNSLLLLCIHYFDWMLAPWQALPLMAEIPGSFFLAGCVRSVVDVLLALLFKKV